MEIKITDLTCGMKAEKWLEETFYSLLGDSNSSNTYEAFGLVLRLFSPTTRKDKRKSVNLILKENEVYHQVQRLALSFLKDNDQVTQLAIQEALGLQDILNRMLKSLEKKPDEAAVLMVDIVKVRDRLESIDDILRTIKRPSEGFIEALRSVDDRYLSQYANVPKDIIKGCIKDTLLYDRLCALKYYHMYIWWGDFDL